MSAPTGGRTPKGYSKASIQNYTPEMMELFKSLFSHLGPDSFLAKIAGGDESAFAEMEAPALRQFTGMQGNLASRFSGMGGMGARGSSGFQNTMNAAASDFSQDLQSKRTGMRMDAIKELMGLSNQLLGQRPYEQAFVEKSKPWWQEALTGFANKAGEGAGKAAGAYFLGG